METTKVDAGEKVLSWETCFYRAPLMAHAVLGPAREGPLMDRLYESATERCAVVICISGTVSRYEPELATVEARRARDRKRGQQLRTQIRKDGFLFCWAYGRYVEPGANDGARAADEALPANGEPRRYSQAESIKDVDEECLIVIESGSEELEKRLFGCARRWAAEYGRNAIILKPASGMSAYLAPLSGPTGGKAFGERQYLDEWTPESIGGLFSTLVRSRDAAHEAARQPGGKRLPG